jgi:hypothetical protein
MKTLAGTFEYGKIAHLTTVVSKHTAGRISHVERKESPTEGGAEDIARGRDGVAACSGMVMRL